MRALLDWLIARQGRLMADLARDPARPPADREAATAPPMVRAPSPERRLAQQRALALADTHLAMGNLIDAAALLRPFEEDAVDVRVLTTLARVESVSGDHTAALHLLERAYQLDPGDAKVPYFTAEVLELLGRHQEAIPYRRRVAFWANTARAQPLVELIQTIARSAPTAKRMALGELKLSVEALAKAPDLATGHALEVCQTLYGLTSMREGALSLYARHSPCPDDHVDTDLAWSSLWQWSAAAGVPMHALADGGIPGHRPRAACVSEAVFVDGFQFTPIVSSDSVALTGISSRPQRLQAQDPQSPVLMNADDTCRLRMPRERRVVAEACVLVGGSGNYYSDVVEHVGSLATIEHFDLQAGRRLLLGPSPSTAQRELLALLGYDEEALVTLPPGGASVVKDVWVPTSLAQAGRWIDPLLPAWYRRRLGKLDRRSRKIYLLQEPNAHARVANERAITEHLRGRGFDIVAPGEMTLGERIRLMGQASFVVASSGAALADMVFAAPGLQVVALYNRAVTAGGKGLFYDALAAACAHEFARVDCAPVQLASGLRASDADVAVDLDALDAAIESGLSGETRPSPSVGHSSNLQPFGHDHA